MITVKGKFAEAPTAHAYLKKKKKSCIISKKTATNYQYQKPEMLAFMKHLSLKLIFLP